MKRTLTPIGVLCYLLLAINVASAELPRVAVLDLKPEKISTNKAIALSKHLRKALRKAGKVDVIEREEMGKILAKHKDQLKGCLEEECVIKVCKILNVEDVIASSILKINSKKYVLYIKFLSVKDNMVFNRALRAEVTKEELPDRIQDYASILSNAIFVSAGKVVKIDKDDIYIKFKNGNTLSTGVFLRTVRQSEPIKSLKSNEILGHKKEDIGEIEIIEIIEDTLAIAKKQIRCKEIQLDDKVMLKESSRIFKDVNKLWKVEVKPKLLKKYYVEPKYPEIAKRSKIEGQIMLKLLLGTKGQVIFVEVLNSLHPLCDAAAIKAVSQWRFSPAKEDDKPVKVWLVQPIRFELDK